MSIKYVSLVLEGVLDEAVSRKIFQVYSPNIKINTSYILGGRSKIKERISKYNEAAKIWPFWVLVDLDTDECPPELINAWLTSRNPNLFFRVAVREVEAWLLADRDTFSKFLGVPVQKIPFVPDADAITDPKKLIVTLSRKSSKRDIKTSLPPSQKGTAKIGPDYNGQLSRFVLQHWNPERARLRSPSLDKTIRAIGKL